MPLEKVHDMLNAGHSNSNPTKTDPHTKIACNFKDYHKLLRILPRFPYNIELEVVKLNIDSLFLSSSIYNFHVGSIKYWMRFRVTDS